MNPLTPIIRLVLKIASGLLFLLTIVSAYGGHISPHIWAFPSILTLGFPYFALLTLIVLVAWAIFRRWIMACAALLTLLICSGPLLLISPMGHKGSAAQDGYPKFSLITYNILHGDDVEGHSDVINRSFQYILDSNADIVALQELYNFSKSEIKHLPEAMRDSLFKKYPYRITDGLNDLCLLSRYPARILKVTDKPYGSNYFYEAYRINIGDRKLTVLNVHLASYQLTDGERNFVEQMKSIRGARTSLAEFKGSIYNKLKQSFVNRANHAAEVREVISSIKGPLIICGDFNDVPASWAYYAVKDKDMKDAYTETNFGPVNTYNLHHFYFHIDQIFYRGDIKALSVERGNIRSSDHYPLLATFVFTPKGY